MASVLLVGFLLGAQAGDTAKADLDKMQGDWTAVSGERDGLKLTEEILRSLRRTVNGNTIAVDGGTTPTRARFKYDSTKSSKEIDIFRDGDAEPYRGIYLFDDDMFKICYGAAGAPRPTAFATREGSAQVVMTWKKVKKVNK